ncbi:MAG TPA: glycoside hydrolase family 88 protein [Bacteroidota bacterium]|nr:glycoside hydrolase family 88 protein [Bacteroidota bacterium]
MTNESPLPVAMRSAAIIAVTSIFSFCLAAQQDSGGYFQLWPAGKSPREIGKRVAERFVASPFGGYGRTTPPRVLGYPECCTWYGALTFADLSGDHGMMSRLIKRYEPLLSPPVDSLVPKPDHVDHSVFGIVPFEVYLLTKDPRSFDLGKFIADKQWENPRPDRLSPQTRMWIDDMFMITSLQTQAYRATGNPVYIDRAALEMSVYLDSLQQPNGLFFHAPGAPFFWGRGNGWVAAGMAELLRSLPADNPRRARILEGYKKMMAALLKFQDANGMWHQLIDKSDSWSETSCTGMFTFAMITGVKSGWLDAQTYGPAARKGWLGLVSYIDENADVHEVCEGTNKNSDVQYYLDRKRNVGDMHGQAPILWCASALLR